MSGPAYPGAHVADPADLPRRCPRDGGPWRRIPGGVACWTCPEERYVAAWLAAVVEPASTARVPGPGDDFA
jgi:hypothetical protein